MNSPKAIDAYIGLGSNLGDATEHVQRAFEQLNQLPDTQLTRHSSLFSSEPIDAQGDDFINAVALVRTVLSAPDLLHALQKIENDFGRERPYLNAPRTLDLDILLYGDQRITSADLIVPHPRLTQRAFALIPLLQIDPFINIPGAGPAHSFVMNVTNQTIRKVAEYSSN
jgi:2-amino-4-hydroxy-6-hydroxymethyldihydropteridine diphosphokinase